MFRNFCLKNLRILATTSLKTTSIRQTGTKLYEPVYLDALKPKYPIYPCLNFQIKGYDFAVLESYQRFLHRTANSLDLEVEDGWATPAQQLQITRIKSNSNIAEDEYKLAIYERNIQLIDVAAKFYPIFLRLVQAALPEGVTIAVMEHEQQAEDIRYVPDTNLKELQEQLEELGGARKPKYKKR